MRGTRGGAALGLAAGLLAAAAPLAAQQSGAALVVVRVQGPEGPLAEAAVRIGRRGAFTGGDGTARLTVPSGVAWAVASRIGFRPDSIRVEVPADGRLTVAVTLVPRDVELEEVSVTSTRGERRLEDDPVRVEVLGGEDVAEKTQMRPSDLTRLLSEMVGVRMQQSAGALGATRLRIQGLRGQYTGVLADGLPLYGGQAGGFGVLQLAPLDLKQAEVIKGAATALYGPSALGGLLNLISRRPEDGMPEGVLNQTARGGSDALVWGGSRLSPTVGLTLFADAHRQPRQDRDGDGWADIAGFSRASLRPRLFVDRPNGDALFVTAGVLHESRIGGFLAGGPSPYTETLGTDRLDAGATARHGLGHAGRLQLRASGMLQWQTLGFGGLSERQRRRNLFAEASWLLPRRGAELVVGAAVQHDALRAPETRGAEFTYTVPALFSQLTLTPSAVAALTLSGRCDAHNVFGTVCNPRVSALWRPAPGVTLRTSGALGSFAPTPLTDETDAIGLRRVAPLAVRDERARTASFDVGWTRGMLQLSGTLAASRLDHPVRLVPIAGDPSGRLEFVNSASPVRILSGEVFGVYTLKPVVATVFYGYLRATEDDGTGRGRREQSLTPRHSGGVDVTWEDAAHGTWIALEAFYTGVQALDDDPTRTRSRPYAVAELLLSQRIGSVQAFLNVDNIFDARLTRYSPLLLPEPGLGGRRTITPWMPTDGRIIAVGIRALLGGPRP